MKSDNITLYQRYDRLISIMDQAEVDVLDHAYDKLIIAEAEMKEKKTTASIKANDSILKTTMGLISQFEMKYFPPDKCFISIKQVFKYLVADNYNIALRTVQLHHQKEHFAARADGFYYITDIKLYAEKYLQKKEESTTLSDDKLQTDIDLKVLRKEREQLLIQKLKGEVIERTVVENEFASRIFELRTSLLGLKKSLAPLLVGLTEREIEEHIDREARYILMQYARKLEALR